MQELKVDSDINPAPSRKNLCRDETFRKGLCVLQVLLVGMTFVGENESERPD